MKLRYKITGSILLLVTAPLIALAIALSYEADCAPAPALPAGATAMKAIVYRCYGPPEVLKLETIAKPMPADDEILVKVRAAAVNPLDWHRMRGEPYLMRRNAGIGAPKNERIGVDFAGIVEAVGQSVTTFKPGDEVFGLRTGAFAEYVTVGEDRNVVLKPVNATFEQAAAIPVAAGTALQALRDQGRVHAGQKVLINGASGGVGTYAVQIAKSFGAEVTGVCGTRNVQMVRSIGADHVIDYTKEDFTKGGQRYDVIVDTVGNHSLWAYRGVLQPQGILVIVGAGSREDKWIGGRIRPIQISMVQPFASQQFVTFRSDPDKQDLRFLGNLMQEGKLRSVIDRRYTLGEVPAAVAYVETGRARGKVVIVP